MHLMAKNELISQLRLNERYDRVLPKCRQNNDDRKGRSMSTSAHRWGWTNERDGKRVPPGIDPSKPSVARVYDYMIGGKDNFAADREVGRKVLEIAPEAPWNGHANRAFLRRAVTFMAREAGIRQFLDNGSFLKVPGALAAQVPPAATDGACQHEPAALGVGAPAGGKNARPKSDRAFGSR
jgi:hypothetical protein